MKEKEKMAYIAGILDGDGSFSILKSGNSYHPCIQLSNAFKGMSEFLYDEFKGSLRIKKPQKDHHKVLYVWSVRGLGSCKECLKRIMPFLVFKKERAKLMLDFIEKSMIKRLELIEGARFNLKMKDQNRKSLMADLPISEQTIECSNDSCFWSYFAGIIDTEGSFSIKREKPHSGSVSLRYNPCIQLTQATIPSINYIRENCSLGSFCIPRSSCTQRGFAYKQSILSKSDVVRFVKQIFPYLRFKKEQSLTILNFCENYGATAHRRGGVAAEVMEFREKMYQQMKKLNA